MLGATFNDDALPWEAYQQELLFLLMEDIVLPVITEEQRAHIFDAVYDYPDLQEWLIDAGVGWA